MGGMIHTTQECRIGDACELLCEMPDDSVDMVITSPPYWDLRDYGVDGQIGLEPTLEEYHTHLLEVTAECMRVLKPTGVMFWNHGDSYGGSGSGSIEDNKATAKGTDATSLGKSRPSVSLTPKCMTMQNERLIIRMIDDQGWILRNRIIWNKPNGMPSSVQDRFSNKYEPVYMLVKSKPRSNDIKMFIDPPISSDWRGWLAAIIDGEGTIGIRRSKMKDKHDTFGAYVTVSNTSKEIVDRCAELTRLGTVRNHPGTNFKMYRWEVTHQKAISVIGEIYPYLIDKKEQAKVAIALQRTNIHRGNNKNTNRGPSPISKKEYEAKESLWELIKSLNQKEVVDSGLPEPNLNRYGGCEDYWFDLDAVRVPAKYAEVWSRKGAGKDTPYAKNNPRSRWGVTRKEMKRAKTADESYKSNGMRNAPEPGEANAFHPLGKNPGDVWTIPTQPYPESHFATFPTALIEPMIKAACPAEICPVCGLARERITERVEGAYDGPSHQFGSKSHGGMKTNVGAEQSPYYAAKTIGWTDCRCGAGWIAGTVLDPFCGSGTVLEVCRLLNRNAIGFELNLEYESLIRKRSMAHTPPLTAYEVK